MPDAKSKPKLCRDCEEEYPRAQCHGDVDTERARAEKAERERDTFRERLIDSANEEPVTGWLERGEDGFENTPQGAREARDAAIQRAEKAEALLRQVLGTTPMGEGACRIHDRIRAALGTGKGGEE